MIKKMWNLLTKNENKMIETCKGIYNRDSVGFEKLLEEWVEFNLNTVTNSVQIDWIPCEEFPDYDESWMELALENLRTKGYGVDSHTTFSFGGGWECSDGFKKLLEETNG